MFVFTGAGCWHIFPLLGQELRLLPFAFKLPIPVLVGSMFISGICTSVFALIWTHTLQEMVPGEYAWARIFH